jgi:hypothetical protein
MPDFNVRSDSVNVEQIMEQIRSRISERRGVDYTEQQIRELAAVKLEKFLDPKGVRSDLLEQFRQVQRAHEPPAPPNYAFEAETMFETHRAPLRWIRGLLRPLLKLFFNPNPLVQALHIQSQLNTLNAERETARRGMDQLHYEVMHNLVLEVTRMSIEVKNLKMRVESVSSRLDFNERRARALESVVVYKPSADEVVEREPAVAFAPPKSAAAPQPMQAATPMAGQPSPAATSQPGEGPGQRSRRRRGVVDGGNGGNCRDGRSGFDSRIGGIRASRRSPLNARLTADPPIRARLHAKTSTNSRSRSHRQAARRPGQHLT